MNPGERRDEWGPWQTFCPPTVSPSFVCVRVCVPACVCTCMRVHYPFCASMKEIEQDAGGSVHISGAWRYAKLCQWL